MSAAPPRSLALASATLDVLGARAPRVVVAAHPDDEIIGASSLLVRWPDAFVVHVTDGAPRNEALWGYPASTRGEYRRVRRSEARAALSVLGIAESRIASLGFVDQEAARDLVRLTLEVERVLGELQAKSVLVQPYEGGHPDHDACVFAVWAAVERAREAQRSAPDVFEMTGYHRAEGALRAGVFLPGGPPEAIHELASHERELKARAMACHRSQARVLAAFAELQDERFRRSPGYDFTQPPHSGALHYETLGWPLPGEEWRRLARDALATLSLAHPQR